MIVCVCGFTGDEQDYDCLGACDENLLCPICNVEFTPEGFLHEMSDCCVESTLTWLEKDRLAYIKSVTQEERVIKEWLDERERVSNKAEEGA